MGALPFRRFFFLISAVTLFACCCAYAAGSSAIRLHADPTIAIFATTFVSLVIPGSLVMLWWYRVNRAAGVPVLTTSLADAVRFGVVSAAFIIAAIALAVVIFDVTHSRIAQAAVAIVSAPAGFFLVRNRYASMYPPRPEEAPGLRVGAVSSALLPLIFAAQIGLHISHQQPGLSGIYDLFIAAWMVSIPLFAFSAYFMWRRSLAAATSTVGGAR